MLTDPSTKYQPFAPIALSDRRWPQQSIQQAPIWLSTDLRDGNQALVEPMNGQQKLRFFQLLLACGFKEIEVAFAAASQTDFDFVRLLIEQNHIPEDVTIQVMTQARPELISRTIESLIGAKRAIVHLYNATAPVWREQVFGLDKQGVTEMAVRSTQQIKALTAQHPETEWILQYSPETFSATELDFSVEICNAVIEAWQPTPEHKMIINLPSTVEVATPNVYADQIEWMHRHLTKRDSVVLSLHPHNDRGTGIAAAELALMAGAQRVEGCLFGNGERTGNVDLITLALNLYTQGIAPQLDFSDMEAIRRQVEAFNQLPVHPRHPYAGDLVFTAFSGSHQDAIQKGMAQHRPDGVWQVPYLSIDPADLKRGYDAVIRVNSQSGKGGVSYLLAQYYGLQLPRRLQIDFSQKVQQLSDSSGQELSAQALRQLFSASYQTMNADWQYQQHHVQPLEDHQVSLEITIGNGAACRRLQAQGNGPLDALIRALDLPVQVLDFQEHALGSGSDAEAIAYLELQLGEQAPVFGVAQDRNLERAVLKAALAGLGAMQLEGFAASL